jgi:hypothetical protein
VKWKEEEVLRAVKIVKSMDSIKVNESIEPAVEASRFATGM